MRSQLIPPPDLSPPSVGHLPVEKRIQIWAELVDASEAILMAGLRHSIGPDGDLQQAYRQWNDRQRDEHERRQRAFLENLSRREANRGH